MQGRPVREAATSHLVREHAGDLAVDRDLVEAVPVGRVPGDVVPLDGSSDDLIDLSSVPLQKPQQEFDEVESLIANVKDAPASASSAPAEPPPCSRT